MNARTEELIRFLDERLDRLRAAVEAIPANRRDEKPDPERWSVAEVLEHLIAIERGTTQVFIAHAGEGEPIGDDFGSGSVLDTVDMGMLLDRSRKRVTAEARRPTGTLDAATGWAQLEEARRGLVEQIRRADGVSLEGVMHDHPVGRRLNLYQWVVFVGGHQARHEAQIVEIGESLSG
jgi:hypothetical protein